MKRGNRWVLSLALLGLVTGVGGQSPASQAPATTQRDAALLPGMAASDVPNDIAWGPGREVQAGVRGRPWATNQHAGLFTFDVYIRNRTNHVLTVSCPSYSGYSVASDDTDYTTLVQSPLIYCTPHIRDGRGRPVDVSPR